MVGRRLDFDAINRAALAACPALLFRWFPNGKLKGHEFTVGSLAGEPGDSLSINIKTGQWADFAADHRGGDMISLCAAKHGVKQGAGARQLTQELGIATTLSSNAASRAAPRASAPMARPGGRR